jgi:prolyl 4-hydroxylase
MAERPAKGGLRRRHGAVMLLMGLLAVPTAAEAPHHRGPQESGACHVEQTRSEIAPTQPHSHSRLYEHLDFEILSERPRMYYFPRFLSDEPCDRIRELGLPHLKPSQTDAGLAKKVRSSTSYFFSQEQERASPEIMAVKHRAEAISRITLEYQEELQIQHYKTPRLGGQQKDFYIPHFDWIPSRPRVATLLIYLEEPEEGGETIFPLVRRNSSNRNAQLFTREQAEPLTLSMWNAGACALPEEETHWLRVRPRKGAAVLFYNLLPDNSLDPLSIHGSCPVLRGQKTVVQQWLSTIMMAPVYSPGLQALWRQPSFKRPLGSVDASGHHRSLTARKSRLRGDEGICSPRGLLRDGEESGQFSIAFLVAVESCSASLRLTLAASRKNAPQPAVWEVAVESCQVRLTVPGSYPEAALSAPVEHNQWVHVTVLTEDLSFDPVAKNLSSAYDFRSHLIVQGKHGAQSVRGTVKRERSEGAKRKGSLNWGAARLCLFNLSPDHADFAEVYVLSRQLSAAELNTIRQKSAGDRMEPRPDLV